MTKFEVVKPIIVARELLQPPNIAFESEPNFTVDTIARPIDTRAIAADFYCS